MNGALLISCAFLAMVLNRMSCEMHPERGETVTTLRMIVNNTIERVSELVSVIHEDSESFWQTVNETSQLSNMMIGNLETEIKSIYLILDRCKVKMNEDGAIAAEIFNRINTQILRPTPDYDQILADTIAWHERNSNRALEIEDVIKWRVGKILELSTPGALAATKARKIENEVKKFFPLVDDGGLIIEELIKNLKKLSNPIKLY